MSENEKVDPLKAESLEEVDHLRAQLLNRDMDMLTLQRELLNGQFKEVNSRLTAFSMDIVTKYGLNSPKQVDVATGKINRDQPKEEKTDGQ